MFTWAGVQRDTNFGFWGSFYQIQNSVTTCHKELIQYKPILLVQICSKHFEGFNQGAVCWSREHLFLYSQQKSAIKVQNASSCSSSWFGLHMFWVTFVCGVHWNCPTVQPGIAGLQKWTGCSLSWHSYLWNSFASPPPPRSISFFHLPSKHSMLTKCIRSGTVCSQRPLTKEIQWGK